MAWDFETDPEFEKQLDTRIQNMIDMPAKTTYTQFSRQGNTA